MAFSFDKKSFLKVVPPGYEPLVAPVLTMIVVIVLSVSVAYPIYQRIQKVRAEISQVEKSVNVLEEKASLLSSAQKSTLSEQAENVLTGLPGADPSLSALSTIRITAVAQGFTLRSIGVTGLGGGKETLNTVNVNFEITGLLDQTLQFLSRLNETAPLMRVTTVEMTNSGDGRAFTGATVVVFWGPLPKTLGKVDAPLELLKQDEETLLNTLSNLQVQSLVQVVPSPPQTGRTNPFGL